jgi:hypothetical protein
MLQLSNIFEMPDDYKSNGCGAEGARFDFVPDTIYFVSIFEACRIHDWAYKMGETSDDKIVADLEFLNNLLKIINNVDKWYYPTALARRRAYKYYYAVKRFGFDAFWNNKEGD